jgi:hypothetical protein
MEPNLKDYVFFFSCAAHINLHVLYNNSKNCTEPLQLAVQFKSKGNTVLDNFR